MMEVSTRYGASISTFLFFSYLDEEREKIYENSVFFYRWNALVNQLTQIITRFWSKNGREKKKHNIAIYKSNTQNEQFE